MIRKFRARQRAKTDVRRLIRQGEGATIEFKQSLEADARTGAKDPKALDGVLKAIAAFLNTDGGTLLIGVSDDGQIRGLEQDYALLGKKQNDDGFELKLGNLIRAHLKPLSLRRIAIKFEALPEGTICRVDVIQSSHAVYLNEKEAYVRDGNTTRKLEGPDLDRWLSEQHARRRWKVSLIVALGIVLIALLTHYFLTETALAVLTRPSLAGLDEPLTPCALPAAPPENSEAKSLYTKGCQMMRLLDYPSARPLLEKAVSIEPQNVPARIALADVWSWLGYDERATEEAARAVELSRSLSPEITLWVRGKYYEIGNDFDKATETYQALWKLSPDNLDYGLQLATVQLEAGDAQDAFATIDKLRNLPRPAGDDPRIDLQEAQTAEFVDEPQRQRKAAEAALKKSKGKQRLLAAEAKRWLGMAHRQLGDEKSARTTLKDAKDTFESLGDHVGAALVQQEIAEMLQEQGDFEEASVIYGELVRFFKEIGNTEHLAGALGDIAKVLTAKGDVGGAVRAYDDMLAATTNVRDRSGSATALARKGDLLVWEGDLAVANNLDNQSLALAREIRDKNAEADALDSLASTLIKMGDLGGATEACREIKVITAAQGTKSITTEIWPSLIELALETGNNTEAEALARQFAEQHAQVKSPLEARDKNLLARALLAQGKLPQAQAAITRATSILDKSKDLHLRLEAAITAAQIRAALGPATDAERDIERVAENAQRVGFLDVQLEARLALGIMELRVQRGDIGHGVLATVRADASAKGFRLIAGKAAAAAEDRR